MSREVDLVPTGKRKLERTINEVIRGVRRLRIEVQKMRATFPAELSVRGNSYYLKVPPNVVHHYQLLAGDSVEVRLLEVRRINPEAED